MIDPRRLLTFREVARQQSFSRAGEALALTQPAVSQQVRALETQLGARLIERGPGRFALTAAGTLLLAHADALSERLQLADAQLRESVAAGRVQLRLGAFPSILAAAVPGVVARLEKTVPGLQLSVIEGGTAQLTAAVRDGRIHVALCFQSADDAPRRDPETQRRDVLEEPMVAAVAPGHRLAQRRRIRLEQLADETWTAATRDGLIYRACVAAGFEPKLAYLTADPLAIRSLVASQLAVTLTPRLLAPHLHGIATVTLTRPPRRIVYAVMPPAGVHSLVAPFIEALGREVRSFERLRNSRRSSASIH